MEKEDVLVPVEVLERNDWVDRVDTDEKDRSDEVQDNAGVGCSVGEGDWDAQGEEPLEMSAMIRERGG